MATKKSLRELVLSLLNDEPSEDAITRIHNYGLKTDENVHRLPKREEQYELAEVTPLLLAVATSSGSQKARAAAFRATGNALVHSLKDPALMSQAEEVVHFGFIDAAVDALDMSRKDAIDTCVRREAARLINNLAALPSFHEHLRKSMVVSGMVKHVSLFGTENEEPAIIGMCVGALSYMCFREENQESLLASGVVEALLPIANSKSPKYKFVRAMLGVAALVGQEEKHPALEASETIVKSATKALQAALEEKPYPPGSNTFNTPDNVLHGMYSLAGNENNKVLLAEGGAVPILAKILEDENHPEDLRVLAARTLRRMCFNADNAATVAKLPGFKALLQTLRSTEGPLASQADGILWQIDGAKHAAEPNKLQQGTGDKQVMLSYCWANQGMVREVRTFLKSHGIRTWMDIDEMAGSTLEAMSRAVETSEVIVIFFSKPYKNSTSCRTEAEYAYLLRKKIVPVRVDGYQPDGWLGAMLGTRLWYDVRDPATREPVFERLLQEIRRKTGTQPASSNAATATQPVTVDAKPSADLSTSSVQMTNAMLTQPLPTHVLATACWQREDIHAWLKDNDCSEFAGLFTNVEGAGFAALLTSSARQGPVDVCESMQRLFRIKRHPERLLKLAFRLYEFATQVETQA